MIKKITQFSNRLCESHKVVECDEANSSTSIRKSSLLPTEMVGLARTGLVFSFFFLLSFTTNKLKKFIPPGTTQISENFFADETEVSNGAWQEYEASIKTKYGKNSAEYAAALPDTLVWRQKNSYNEPYVQYYYRHPAYKDFPVVGISYEQANAFCKWRTEKVKQFYLIAHKKEINCEYRLPTQQEWEMLADIAPSVISKKGLNEKGLPTFNHRWMTDSIYKKYLNEKKIGLDVTAPVYSYWKNTYGLFNLYGNVAEMINEKGICKGGGWCHLLDECRAGKNMVYEKPTSWLGFRCVCIVK